MSASDRGSKLPAFGPEGLAWPFSQMTASAGIPHIWAARAQSLPIASRAAWIVAKPLEKVARLPSVTSLKPRELVSATTARTLS
jgi:hypothetical protein